jgi:predicted thioredoxin/glutaredoxin
VKSKEIVFLEKKIFQIIASSPVELLQNKRCLRYIQAQHSEIFHVFAKRLAHALV